MTPGQAWPTQVRLKAQALSLHEALAVISQAVRRGPSTKLLLASRALPEVVRGVYQANWLCYIASHATERAAELDRQTMQRVLALPGDLWLDVRGDDTVQGDD